MSLSSAEKSRHNNVNALFFSASSKTGLFFSFFFSHRSQVATSYFCPLAAGGADLIQHIQASRTPCCSPPHSRMDADEAQGSGHRAGYSAIIMYLQKKTQKKPHQNTSFFCSFCSCAQCAECDIWNYAVALPWEWALLYLQTERVLFHGVRHFAPPCFLQKPGTDRPNPGS